MAAARPDSTAGQAGACVHAVIRGAVQGVGFRPFVYRLATELGLAGHVANTPAGVVVVAEGPRGRLEAFLESITADSPPLSIVDSIETDWHTATGLDGFHIRHSDAQGEHAAYILPDIATCPACLADMRDPGNRRYRYPFTNCTHCGPRFSIIHRLPYDRPNTSMRGFAMCPACRTEYENPLDRRFHAQPTACPECGPQLALWDATGAVQSTRDEALLACAQAIRDGRVLAVKGLGGFHLMANARNEDAVQRLRDHKHREEKPFALMAPALEHIRALCAVSDLEARLLKSPECPIVLLDRLDTPADGHALAEAVAPGAPRFGIMLPSTPLHHLLLEALGFPVIATSGNLSEEPICIDEHEALERLHGIADRFLVHNRPIVRHVDDSIAHVVMGREMLLRRARGYAPLPVQTGEDGPVVLAVGGHLKNTIAIAKRGQVFSSQHIGDLETPRAFDAFVEAAHALENLYEATPELVACDLHPDYLSTKHAQGLNLPLTQVQHHYAHVLACMAEHGLDRPVLGVAWDGTGYGTDGTVWGGEFLLATRDGFERRAWLRPFLLPGGDKAVKEPRRAAAGVLFALFGPEGLDRDELPPIRAFAPHERKTLAQMMQQGVNAPQTTSAGRLFDAAASLAGLFQQCSFEGQAAMALEYAARHHAAPGPEYELPIRSHETTCELDWGPLMTAIADDAARGLSPGPIATGFHMALARAILTLCQRIGIRDVVLTGGCFQNTLLSESAIRLLQQHGFQAHWHRRVPPNDGGIALGQAVYALRCARTPKKGSEPCA